ncbi:hypothetical protein GO986_21870 [Deinococcus sp. HMF7620]|uniref:Uncharacterized protein n=1 Tax=Deinococcus arboris TaxID=2682977 RepID=A0A7C9HV22_9DEIO|nr:hypothetical protein [Deinococcus arboris]MVN89387.1 hypothetical protein [Deinococcus arboris]
MIDAQTGSGASAPPGTMTIMATGATTPAKPAASAGLYTVPLGSTEPLRKGVAKLQFKVTTPLMKRAAHFLLNQLSGGWDKRIIPAIHAALRAKGVPTSECPAGTSGPTAAAS